MSRDIYAAPRGLNENFSQQVQPHDTTHGISWELTPSKGTGADMNASLNVTHYDSAGYEATTTDSDSPHAVML